MSSIYHYNNERPEYISQFPFCIIHDKKIYVKDLIKQIFKVNKLKNWRIRIKNKTPGDSFGAITSNKYLKKKFINHKFVSLEEGLKRYFIWIYKVNKKNFYKSHPYKIDKNYIL